MLGVERGLSVLLDSRSELLLCWLFVSELVRLMLGDTVVPAELLPEQEVCEEEPGFLPVRRK